MSRPRPAPFLACSLLAHALGATGIDTFGEPRSRGPRAILVLSALFNARLEAPVGAFSTRQFAGILFIWLGLAMHFGTALHPLSRRTPALFWVAPLFYTPGVHVTRPLSTALFARVRRIAGLPAPRLDTFGHPPLGGVFTLFGRAPLVDTGVVAATYTLSTARLTRIGIIPLGATVGFDAFTGKVPRLTSTVFGVSPLVDAGGMLAPCPLATPAFARAHLAGLDTVLFQARRHPCSRLAPAFAGVTPVFDTSVVHAARPRLASLLAARHLGVHILCRGTLCRLFEGVFFNIGRLRLGWGAFATSIPFVGAHFATGVFDISRLTGCIVFPRAPRQHQRCADTCEERPRTSPRPNHSLTRLPLHTPLPSALCSRRRSPVATSSKSSVLS